MMSKMERKRRDANAEFRMSSDNWQVSNDNANRETRNAKHETEYPARETRNPKRKTNTWLVIALLLVLASTLASTAFAQNAGSFARLGFGARGMAMSNALIADVNGNTSPYYNPALAPFASRQNLQASVAFMTFDRELQFLQFASALPPSAGIAAGLIHAGVSNIDGRTSSGYHTENLSTDEYAVFLAFGLKLGQKASIGLGLQVFRADYLTDLEPVNSAGLDVGLTIQVTPALRLGVVADDLLAKYLWDTSGVLSTGGKSTTDKFPVRLRIGGAYSLMDGRASIVAEYESRVSTFEFRRRLVETIDLEPIEAVEIEELQIQQNLFRLGVEYKLAPIFALRGGVDRLGDTDGGARPTAGFMVEQSLGSLVSWFEYAFALEPYGTGTMHVLTLRLFL